MKEDILSKLRELMPFTKPAAVRERYFKLIDEWDAAGKVPRQDVKRMERSLAEVQDAFREASSTTKAESASPKDERQEAMLAQLEDTIAKPRKGPRTRSRKQRFQGHQRGRGGSRGTPELAPNAEIGLK